MKNIIFIMTLLLCSHCNAQAPDSIKHYNPQHYKDWEPDPEYCGKSNPCSINDSDFHLMKGDKRVRVWENNEVIHVEISNKITPYTYFFAYNSKNKLIIGSYIMFYRAICGLDIDYDKKGKIIKEKNLDAPYPLSIEDMVKKFKKEYNVDLLNRKNVFKFKRYELSTVLGVPLYEIWLKTEITNRWIEYLIDGKSGKTLYKMNTSEGDERGSIYQEYLISIGKYKGKIPKYDASRD